MISYYPDAEDTKCHKGSTFTEDNGVRLFYDLWQTKMHQLYLPETIGKLCCASYRGWLVLAAAKGTEVFLLNPLTRARIELPPFTTPVKVFRIEKEDYLIKVYYWFEDHVIGNFFISKLAFTTDLSDPNCVIMVFFQRTCRIFMCRVGDPCWTMVNQEPNMICPTKFSDAAYHDGRFYLLSHEGLIRVYDLKDPKKRLARSFQPDLEHVNKFLMEGESGVFMVVVHVEEGVGEAAGGDQEGQDDSSDDVEDPEKGPRMKIELFRFLEQNGGFGIQQIIDTRDITIFCGDNKLCLAVSSDWASLDGGSLYICRPHAGDAEGESCYGIYFTKLDDFGPELVVGDLGEQPQLRPAARAMWFQPSFV